jgi:hypothetical protein
MRYVTQREAAFCKFSKDKTRGIGVGEQKEENRWELMWVNIMIVLSLGEGLLLMFVIARELIK